jgi:hypothetical protein
MPKHRKRGEREGKLEKNFSKIQEKARKSKLFLWPSFYGADCQCGGLPMLLRLSLWEKKKRISSLMTS